MKKEERHNLAVYLNEQQRERLNLEPFTDYKKADRPDKVIVTMNPEDVINAQFFTVTRFAGSIVTPEVMLNIMYRYAPLNGRLTYKDYIADLDLDTYNPYPYAQSWMFEDSVHGTI